MIFFDFILAIPILGIVFFIFFGHHRSSGIANIAFSLATLIVSVYLGIEVKSKGFLLFWHNQIYIDAFSFIMLILTTFICFSVAIFSNSYMQHNVEDGRINVNMLRLYYIMYQIFMFTMILVYSSNNIGMLWVAMEGATLSTVLLVSLYRTPASIEAAWKYFILCIVGIALALFGTVLVYFSAKNIAVDADSAMLWTVLRQHVMLLDPKVLIIAFVFLFVGYGTKVGLIPLHFWLPDAHSESPAPMSALLSGLLLNIGIYALVRFKTLVDPVTNTNITDHLMITFGLLSFVVSGFFIYRQWNIKRMFSYSSVEHMGLITFSFGLGGTISAFIALYYLIVHSLVKSALFMSVGNVIRVTKTQDINKIRGLITTYPSVGWALLIGTVAIAGLPPFGIFNSELMLVLLTVKQHILLTLILIFGLILSISGLFKNLHPVIFGHSLNDASTPIKVSLFPIVLNLSLALFMGLYLPHWLSFYLHKAASIIIGHTILL